MSLVELIVDPRVSIEDIGAFLDGLAPAARWGQVNRLGRDQQRKLYHKAQPIGPALDELVGAAGERVEVIHDGLNTLPLPPPWRRFQKRFCRAPGIAEYLYGYNEGPLRGLIGPGYFLAASTGSRPEWRARGGVVVDYFRVPDGPVPDGWPPVRPNSSGPRRFVFHQTRDFLRAVSAHVTIGAAVKRERPLDHYFVLCRRP